MRRVCWVDMVLDRRARPFAAPRGHLVERQSSLDSLHRPRARLTDRRPQPHVERGHEVVRDLLCTSAPRPFRPRRAAQPPSVRRRLPGGHLRARRGVGSRLALECRTRSRRRQGGGSAVTTHPTPPTTWYSPRFGTRRAARRPHAIPGGRRSGGRLAAATPRPRQHRFGVAAARCRRREGGGRWA